MFELDGQFEIWRRNPNIDLDWYLELEAFVRSNNDTFYENDINSYIAYGFSYLDLAKRAHIMWAQESAFCAKSDVAETVMKEYVNENIGPSALSASGRYANNVMAGLTIEADGALGPTWDGDKNGANLLKVLQDISIFTQEEDDPIFFDIVGTGDATFEFKTYAGQRRSDRTTGNADGNVPVVFSTGFGNMIIPTLSNNRSEEKTAIYATGRGTGDAEQYAVVENSDVAESPWNRIEDTVSGSSDTSGEDQADQLISIASKKLNKTTFTPHISASVIQQANTYYGKQYKIGDKITIRYKSIEYDMFAISLSATVSKNTDGESLKIEFADRSR